MAGLLGLGLMSAPSSALAASGTVKIGNTTADKLFLHIAQHYRTTRTTQLHVMVTSIHSHQSAKTKTLTLPKGVTLAAKHETGANYRLDASLLSYRRLKPLIKQGYIPVSGEMTTLKSRTLVKVKRPAFLPAYSYGDLYPGHSQAAITRAAGNQEANRIQLTADGYLDRYQPNHQVLATARLQVTPTLHAKIQRTKVTKHGTRYLYFKTKLPGLTTKHVRRTGTARYRLTLTNNHRPIHNPGNSDNDLAGWFYSRYTLGGHAYFTPLGNDGPGD